MLDSESVYAPPKSRVLDKAADSELASDGRYVVARAETHWPARCYRCNDDAHQRLALKVTYMAWWLPFVGVAILFACQFFLMRIIEPLIVLLLLSFFVRKNIRIKLPICDHHELQRKRLFWAQWLGVLLFTLCLIGALILHTGILGIGVLIALLGLIALSFFNRKLYASRYQDGLFWIKGTGQAFRDSLPPFN